jgi:hypothetical protein
MTSQFIAGQASPVSGKMPKTRKSDTSSSAKTDVGLFTDQAMGTVISVQGSSNYVTNGTMSVSVRLIGVNQESMKSTVGSEAVFEGSTLTDLYHPRIILG